MEGTSREQFEEAILGNDHLAPMDVEDATSSSRTTTENDIDANSSQQQDQETPISQSSIWKSIQSPDQITAMLSNYSTSFNVVSISIVLPMLETDALYSAYVDVGTNSLCTSALIAGMIIGQLVGGTLGDLIGRRTAMYLVMVLQIVASLGSSILVRENYFFGWNVFEQLSAWRFILGIGCGGVYPLSALLSSESHNSRNSGGGSSSGDNNQEDISMESSSQDKVRSLKMLATTFSMQGFGFVSVPLIGIPLLLIFGENGLDLVWRFLLSFGAMPGIILLYLRWKLLKNDREEIHTEDGGINDQSLEEDGEIGQDMVGNADLSNDNREADNELTTDETDSKQSLWNAIQTEDDLLLKLVGTAGEFLYSYIEYLIIVWYSLRCEQYPTHILLYHFSYAIQHIKKGTWFLFDVVFYGNTLFQPVVLKTAFGYDNGDEDDEFANLVRNIRDSGILSLISLPGYFVSIALIGSRVCFKFIQTPRYIQLQGFVIMAILYSIIAVTWNVLTQHHSLLVILYGSTFFFSSKITLTDYRILHLCEHETSFQFYTC